MLTDSLLTISSLSAGYGEKTIIHEISLTVKPGESIGIVGRNGSGKTTLIRAVMGQIPIHKGNILLHGRDIGNYSARIRARSLAVVSQYETIPYAYKVRELIEMGRYPYQGFSSRLNAEDRETIDRVMNQTGVTELSEQSVLTLSGGQLQRVLIARSLVQDPEILLLDEPTSHLDICFQIEILSYIQDWIGSDRAVIGVFHDLNIASYFCSRVIILKDGVICKDGPPSDIIGSLSMQQYFGIDSYVDEHLLIPSPYVIPYYRKVRRDWTDIHILLISGGGTGSRLMYLFSIAGIQTHAGILWEDDSDARTAEKLSIPFYSLGDGEEVSDELLTLVTRKMEDADLIVVTGMPVGKKNLKILKLISLASTPIFLSVPGGEDLFSSLDFCHGESLLVWKKMIERGARLTTTHEELMEEISGYLEKMD